MKGVMTIKFNKALEIPNDYKLFDDSILDIIINPSKSSDLNLLSFNWTLESYES